MKVAVKYLNDDVTYSNSEEKNYRLGDYEDYPEEDWIDSNNVYHVILSCDHIYYTWEMVETDTMGGDGEHTTYSTTVAVCANSECDKTLDIGREY